MSRPICPPASHKVSLALVACFGILGCTAPAVIVDDGLQGVAEPMIAYATAEPDNRFELASNQPEPYTSIVQRNFHKARFRFESAARQFDLSREATQQEYLPQFRPGMRLDDDGDAGISLNISQILFDGNVREARIREGDAEAVLNYLNTLSETNDAVSDDVGTYLSYWKHRETAAALRDIAKWIAPILSKAQTRATGGIGKASEVTLFQLKLTEIQSDAAYAASQAKVELISLENGAVKTRPKPIQFNVNRTPLVVARRLAEREVARFQFELAKRQRLPELALQSATTIDTDDTETNNALALDGPAMTFGRPAALLMAEENLYLAEGELVDAKTVSSMEIARHRAQIQALRSQQEQSKALMRQAQQRLDDFPDQFAAGSANLTEATSLADSLRRASEAQIDVKYQILNLQREIARMTGSFWQ